MIIGITGGKGGTGKSTVSTSLAIELSKKSKVLLVDADVDCPNDHLILNIERKKVKDIFQPIPKINKEKCKKCGVCSRVCKENAIIQIKGEYPILIPEQCIGCSACMIACPNNAIGKDKKKIGTIYRGKNYGIDFFSAKTEIGVEEESPVVNALKKEVEKINDKYGYIIFDTSPGTHCNVISALNGCDIALSVTEPTPLGEHDAELSLKLLKKLKIPYNVVLNKSDIGNKKIIYDLVKKYNTKIIAEIPYKNTILESYSRGEPIKNKAIKSIINKLK